MRVRLRSVSLVFALALFAMAAWAQQVLFMAPFGPGEPMMLLRQESVQKELTLTPEQITKVDELAEKMHEKIGQVTIGGSKEEVEQQLKELRKEHEKAHAENQKALAQVLKPEQLKRLKQISYQQHGSKAFTDPEVAKAIQLTLEQQKKIQAIHEETGKHVHELLESGSPPDEETQQKMAKLQEASAAKIMKLLTKAQKTKWQELQGKPFKGEIHLDHAVIIRNN